MGSVTLMDEEELRQLIAARIRHWAALRGFSTMDVLAHECRMHKGTLSKFWRGHQLPSLRSLTRICAVLEVTVNDLYLPVDQLRLAEAERAYLSQEAQTPPLVQSPSGW